MSSWEPLVTTVIHDARGHFEDDDSRSPAVPVPSLHCNHKQTVLAVCGDFEMSDASHGIITGIPGIKCRHDRYLRRFLVFDPSECELLFKARVGALRILHSSPLSTQTFSREGIPKPLIEERKFVF